MSLRWFYHGHLDSAVVLDCHTCTLMARIHLYPATEEVVKSKPPSQNDIMHNFGV